MHTYDREALIAKFITQYADILLHMLNKEDPYHPEVNYHIRLSRLTRMHHAQQGRWLTETETLAIIHGACCKLAHSLLLEGPVLGTIRPEELFSALVRIIKG